MGQIGYGVIGLNGIGSLHLRLAVDHPEIELAAVVDSNRSTADNKARDLGVRGFYDHRTLLESGLVDAVSICVPHHLLAPIAIDCLEAGVHVFVEKPMAIDLADADRIVDTAVRMQRVVCVGFQQRTYRLSTLMKQKIDSGELGTLRRVLWTWHEFRPNSFFARDPWRSTWSESGGGLLIHQVSHQLDLFPWLFGRPASVAARISNQIHNVETEDFCSATLTFDSGCIATIQMSLNEPNAMSVRHVTGDNGVLIVPHVKSLVEDVAEVVTIGRFDVPIKDFVRDTANPHAQPSVVWRTHQDRLTSPSLLKWMRPRRLWHGMGLIHRNPPFHAGHKKLLNSFVRSIRGDGSPIVDAESARITVELITGIIVSALSGRTVDFPLDRGIATDVLAGLKSGRSRITRS